MQEYEYKVVPAPHKGTKAKGVKTPEDRFAYSIETVLNQMAAEGWEYQRAELLPSEERSGLTGSTTNWRNVLIFRRSVAHAAGSTASAEQTPQVHTPGPADPPLTAPAADHAETPSSSEPVRAEKTLSEKAPDTASSAEDPNAADARNRRGYIRVSDPRDDQ